MFVFRILRKLLADTTGFDPSLLPINKVFSNIGIFSRFDKCRYLTLVSNV